ncbi:MULTISPECIES: hypothetical protein [Flavobacterium]|uniref:hypothetical protein n=1 Tax=Flavobacterium TaxID=237 RepID=UPI0011826D07|nr:MULTISPECIES: hypothetical protein [Flavobacterium]MCR4032261.1 hypothetical protein [Flavobacterium panacis]
MKNILIILFSTVLLFLKCGRPTEPKNKHHHSEFTKPTPLILTSSESIDSLTMQKKILQISPIKITKATLLKNSYSDHKDIQITFKNLGKKNIKAIRFEWFCTNSFDEPANGRYFYGEGRFTENSIHLLKPNQSKTEFWEDFSTDADKIIEIRPYYIVFTDGTKWELNEEFNHVLLKNLEKNNFRRN